MMSRLLRLIRRKSALIKGIVSIVVVVAFGSFVLYNHDGTLPFPKGESTLDREKRNGGYYPPCYNDSSTYYCRPTIYLIGFQYGGQNLLREALNLHPDIDCYTTGYFSSFSNLTEIDPFNMSAYHGLFQNSTYKKMNGSNTMICDSGSDLARTYDLDPITQLPYLRTAEFMKYLYGSDLAISFVANNPVARFINEYCARKIPDDFEAYVDQSIGDFVACTNDVSRENLSCLYDASLSRLLQAGLFEYYFYYDLLPGLVYGNVQLLPFFFYSFANSTIRYNTMTAIFNALEKEVPVPGDPYWAQLDDLFDFTPDDCDGKNITEGARAKLKEFYDLI